MPFEVVPIIDIPGYGDKAAQLVCEQLKIQSQNDTAKLTEAKGMVYLKVGSCSWACRESGYPSTYRTKRINMYRARRYVPERAPTRVLGYPVGN
jgi:hypothetical protein